MINSTPETFHQDLINLIMETSEDLLSQLDAGMDTIARETTEELSSNPNIPEKSGKYKKSFFLKKTGREYSIKNKKYQLTHLLEKGHENVKTGRRTRAFPHWKQAEEHCIQKIDNLIGRVTNNAD